MIPLIAGILIIEMLFSYCIIDFYLLHLSTRGMLSVMNCVLSVPVRDTITCINISTYSRWIFVRMDIKPDLFILWRCTYIVVAWGCPSLILVLAIKQRSPLYSIRKVMFFFFFLIITAYYNIMLVFKAFKISISEATITRRQCRAVKWRINRDVIIVKKVTVQPWKFKFYCIPRQPPWKRQRKLFGWKYSTCGAA